MNAVLDATVLVAVTAVLLVAYFAWLGQAMESFEKDFVDEAEHGSSEPKSGALQIPYTSRPVR